MELFDSMTVARERGPRARGVLRGPAALEPDRRKPPRAARGQRAHAAALAWCGIEPLAASRAGDLSTGQRRLVELARALATPFRFLLLDEPSSGLDVRETERFGEIVSQFVDETGTGILLVEHDMALVASVCRYIYVLDFGRLIFEGPTSEVLSSEVVRAAYLGSDSPQLDAAVDGEGGEVVSHA